MQLESYSTSDILPDAIRRSSSLVVFKRSLKTHFYIQSFINIVFITFSPRAVNIVKCPWSNFSFIYDTLILTILHYIFYITITVNSHDSSIVG